MDRTLKHLGVSRLSIVVSTHQSRDHHGGLLQVVKRFPVGLFLDGRYGRLRSVLALDDRTLLVTTSNRDGRSAPRAGDDRILVVRVS